MVPSSCGNAIPFSDAAIVASDTQSSCLSVRLGLSESRPSEDGPRAAIVYVPGGYVVHRYAGQPGAITSYDDDVNTPFSSRSTDICKVVISNQWYTQC